ncbi:MAG: type II toxin-antitoxin system HicA family toxin [Candidatus Vogelbacteria bacterium]|nr:type II toxin-antitoxin system HicA family toxin [Candidatus Vogelbacteria bacterium]
MKRIDLLRFLTKKGCLVRREGGRHTVIFNPDNEKMTTVPRHREINEDLSKKICRDVGLRLF